MKAFWNITKFILLAALLIGAFFGYRFFNIWRENDRPVVRSVAWEKSETSLGGSATLLVTLQVPWHRELLTATPSSHPDTLLPVSRNAIFKKGKLTLSGAREWKLRIPFVATDTELLEGQAISIRLKQQKRVSPGSVNVPLPNLAVTTPKEVPRDPINPKNFLQPEEPPLPQTKNTAFTEENSFPWWMIALALLLIIVVTIFALKKATQTEATPPWERALGKLDRLDITQNPTSVVASLTDILKDYTSERYNIAANTKTTSEYLAVVKTIPDLTADEITELPWLARLADAAKFAGRAPGEETPPRALNIVREFVENTTPKVETSDA